MSEKELQAMTGKNTAEEMFNLAENYLFGNGINKDTQKALDCFESILKTESGYSYAGRIISSLGKAINEGDTVAWDAFSTYILVFVGVKEAEQFLNEEIAKGNMLAALKLAYLYEDGDKLEPDYIKAEALFKEVMQCGDESLGITATSELGLLYATKIKEPQKAVQFWEKAAKCGDAQAQHNLGISYMTGRGVNKDEEKGVFWYKKSAEQGDPDSQLNLGLCYFFGEGVEKNEALAMEWYKKAAAQGNEKAQKLYDGYIEMKEKQKSVNTGEKSSQSGGCYIATAVYGSYDCPSVWILRRFRDNVLDETLIGRSFIKAYYAVSPTLVRVCGDKRWFVSFWRKMLDRMVASLRKKGFEDKEYIDKY